MAGFAAATDRDLQRLNGTVLVNGPAFSGKSALVTRIATPMSKTLVLGAGDTTDPGLAARINDLRAARPSHWEHAPIQLDLATQMRAALSSFEQIIVEAINPWIARALFAAYTAHNDIGKAGDITYQQLQAVCQLLREQPQARIYLITADATADLSPQAELPRLQRELCGRAVQHLGINCQHVIQIIAGLPVLIQKMR